MERGSIIDAQVTLQEEQLKISKYYFQIPKKGLDYEQILEERKFEQRNESILKNMGYMPKRNYI